MTTDWIAGLLRDLAALDADGDLPGHGRSGLPAPFTVEGFLDGR